MADETSGASPAEVTSSEDGVVEALRNGRYSDALTALRSLASVPSDDAEGYRELVPVLESIAAGRTDEAFFRLSEEIEASTDLEPVVYALLGEALASAGHRVLAASAWGSAEDDALAQRALDTRDALGLDDDAFNRQLDELAVAYYRARTTRAPEDGRAWEALGRRLLTLDLPTEALAAAECAVARDRSLVWAWVTVGQCLARTGDPEGALARLDEAARDNPSRPEPLNEAATVHLARGSDTEALGCYRRALERAPEDPEAQAGARELLRRLARWDDLARLLDTLATTAFDNEESDALRREADELRAGRHRFQQVRARTVPSVRGKSPPPAVTSVQGAGVPDLAARLRPPREPAAPVVQGSRAGRMLWWGFMLLVAGLFVRWLLHQR